MGQQYCKISNRMSNALIIETFPVNDKFGEFPKRSYEVKPGETVKVKGLRLRISSCLRCEPLRTAEHKQEIVVDRINPEKDPSQRHGLEVPDSLDKSSLDCERAATWPLPSPHSQLENERESWLDQRHKHDELGFLLYKLQERKEAEQARKEGLGVADGDSEQREGQPEKRAGDSQDDLLRLIKSTPVNITSHGNIATIAWQGNNDHSSSRECIAY